MIDGLNDEEAKQVTEIARQILTEMQEEEA